MDTLKQGSCGSDVIQLQTRLRERGFSPGAIDGDFGPGTEAAVLATISVETGRFAPIDEFVSRFNTSPGGLPFDLYDWRKDLGNRGPPDGASFKGRGYVQLTGRANYTKYGPLIGDPTLVEHPERANDPDVAARLLAAFLSAVEIPMKQALQDGDLAAARRLVNGGTHGLDGFIAAYEIGIAGIVAASPDG